ncbi:MAG: CSLREA domain-containing protein [Anaerolineaceae bacterium]
MKANRLYPSLILVIILILVTTGMRPPAPGAVGVAIDVSIFSDEYGGLSSGCSLREAIEAANNNSPFGGCPAGAHTPAVDSIRLPASSYTLTRAGANEDLNVYGDLDIIDDVTISGLTSGATIDAGDIDRVFDILSGANVTLENLTVTGGHSPDGNGNLAHGGGIRSVGSLSLINVVVTGNQAGKGSNGGVAGANGGYGGGIYIFGNSLSILSSRISDNHAGAGQDNTTSGDGGRGGGIFTDAGIVTITNSEIRDNTAGAGGEITTNAYGGIGGGCYCGGTITITGSTISGNTAGSSSSGGGGPAGGIYANGEMTITNSTISGNTSGSTSSEYGSSGNGGGIVASNHVTIRYSTIYDNHIGTGYSAGRGGGIYSEGADYFTLGGTILAGNTNSTGSQPDCFSPGNVNSEDYNLVGITTGCTFSGLTGNSQLGVPGFTLPPLGTNGGPTQTHALPAGNQAIDKIPSGSNGCGTTYSNDQRGYTRPFDGDYDGTAACDIGAFEFQTLSFYLPLIVK